VHLWFLVYLFTFCALAWALPSWRAPSRWLERGLRAPPVLLVVLSAPSALLLWLHPEMRPDLALYPRPVEVLHYGVFFAFGWVLWTAREALGALRAWAWPLLGFGAALGTFVFHGVLQWQPLGHALGGVVAWAMTLGGLGLAFRIPAGERAWLRYLVQASYWVYLVHYPVVLALQLLFAQASGNGVLEYLATVAFTFGVALISFELLVRRTPLGPWLGVKPG
jgi:peptidoglycan/LPS O-acetylase OafA/YrhL